MATEIVVVPPTGDQGLISKWKQLGSSVGCMKAPAKFKNASLWRNSFGFTFTFKTSDFLCKSPGFWHHLSSKLNPLHAHGEHTGCGSLSQAGPVGRRKQNKKKTRSPPGVAYDLVGLTNSYLSQLFPIWLQPQGSWRAFCSSEAQGSPSWEPHFLSFGRSRQLPHGSSHLNENKKSDASLTTHFLNLHSGEGDFVFQLPYCSRNPWCTIN